MKEFSAHKTGERWSRKNSKEKKALTALFGAYWAQQPIQVERPPDNHPYD